MAVLPLSRRVLAALVAALLVGATAAGVLLGLSRGAPDPALPTVSEKIADLRTERAGLQARADAEARIVLLPAFRVAGLLVDGLAARHDRDGERAFDRLPAAAQQPFRDLEVLNEALREALERQTDGARAAAVRAGEVASGALDRLVTGDTPVVLSYTPRFVPPRRAAGDLALPVPSSSTSPSRVSPLGVPPTGDRLATDKPTGGAAAPVSPVPSVAAPRFAPAFAAPGEDEPLVTVEIVGAHLSPAGGASPVLSIGGWRGGATVRDGRLVFSVPRQAFPGEALRTGFTLATLSLRRDARPVTFQLLFTVLPDKPGWFALDQRVQTFEPEANTLVSPEILARAPVGETRTVRRCFDPPAGWRFDRERVRVVIVERLGWQDDFSDATLNTGSVDLVAPDRQGQVCLSVVAKPSIPAARTATIGRFEATLVRDVTVEATVRSGVRALDWREAMRVPLEPGMTQWKLYVRMFDGIDREFDGRAGSAMPVPGVPFLSVETEQGGRALVLRADPAADPAGGP